MKLGILKESKPREARVALTPSLVKTLVKKGFSIVIESEAGTRSNFSDDMYQESGASINPVAEDILKQSDIILKVNAPTLHEAQLMREESICISLLYPYTQAELLEVFKTRRISAFAMDLVPRISRAQKMDALSSQANLAGYKSVLLGANALGKIFPLMMTAAGTITPAKVLIFGAGVAGLQAIATAKRLGANVEVSDVRPETKEQVESLGARFLTVEGTNDVKTEGGYTRAVSADFLAKQKTLIEKHIKDADLVITTALVIGKESPILVTEDMVKSMKPGSVIVDMAVEWGGNCALSEIDKTVIKHGITIIGESNLPALLPNNASQLYAVNISTLLEHLTDENGFNWDLEEEITKGALITYQGALIHEFTQSILSKQ